MRLETRTLYSLLLPRSGLGGLRARPPERSRAGANRPLEQVCDSRKWAQFRQSQVSGGRGAPRAKARGSAGAKPPGSSSSLVARSVLNREGGSRPSARVRGIPQRTARRIADTVSDPVAFCPAASTECRGAKMRVNLRGLAGSWIVLLASAVSLAAAGDLRLIEAVKNHNKAAVLDLLKQHAD